MYYGVEDFLEKTAKTRLAKEFDKVYKDYKKIVSIPENAVKNPHYLYRARNNSMNKAIRFSPRNIERKYDWKWVTGIEDPDALNVVYRANNGRSYDPVTNLLYRKFKPATKDDIMESLQSDRLRRRIQDQAARNSLSKADRDLINKYL